MARPYKTEMAELAGTLNWVAQADISGVVDALQQGWNSPVIAVGSGGSLSAAHHLARLHRRYGRQVSVSLTPYEFRTTPVPTAAHCWIFSAGGTNVDVVAATVAARRAEPAGTNIVTIRRRSPLTAMAADDPYIRMHRLDIPSKKDGFLATNSLFAFCAVLTRAYLETCGRPDDWAKVVDHLRGCLGPGGGHTWRAAAQALGGVQHLVVLHDADTSLGAFDLESKLTEAAIANAQLADYRHFAHGRHHWLAKNGPVSGVLVFASDAERSLARRTINLLPGDIAIAEVEIPATGETAQLSALLAALYLTEELSFAIGIDPGQPGVADFGRKLYNLTIGSPPRRSRAQVAVDRKQAASLAPQNRAANVAAHAYLTEARRQFEEALIRTPLGGVVLDYDGTLVDTRDRFRPPRTEVADEVVRLLREGLPIGIATGRGHSAADDLRAVIPSDLWPLVLVGHYNGALIQDLSSSTLAEVDGEPFPDLTLIRDALRKQDGDALELTLRPHQLTVEAHKQVNEDRLWNQVRELVDEQGFTELRVTRSSHSVDVLSPAATKLNVVNALALQARTTDLLRIGDRGDWPGNDCQLLASTLGLSVDQVSPDPATCWNLAPEGARGSRATLYYLRAVEVRNRTGHLSLRDR